MVVATLKGHRQVFRANCRSWLDRICKNLFEFAKTMTAQPYDFDRPETNRFFLTWKTIFEKILRLSAQYARAFARIISTTLKRNLSVDQSRVSVAFSEFGNRLHGRFVTFSNSTVTTYWKTIITQESCVRAISSKTFFSFLRNNCKNNDGVAHIECRSTDKSNSAKSLHVTSLV